MTHQFNFNNYNIFLNNRTLKIKNRGGGVAILANKYLDVCVITIK